MKRKLSDMFTLPPQIMSARGERHFWEALRLYFLKHDKLLPEDFESFTKDLHAAFEKITGHTVDEQDWFYIEEYAFGGMSSGRIDPVGWRRGGITFDYLQQTYWQLFEADTRVEEINGKINKFD